ncbi:MAG: ubiquinol oxidase subunit II [Simkania sp.]|nr:ubiquinol oxidase subunit II [Simkania sp.]
MKKKFTYTLFILIALALVLLFFLYLSTTNVAVLNPKGLIAEKERDLIIISTILMLIIVIPVFILTIYISWKYKAGNHKAKYSPDWDKNHLLESIWWGFPLVIVVMLSVVTYKSCHELDPFKPIETSVKPMKIQVVALQWKWLFIYPELNIATVNFFQVPEQTPIDFEITADAPMNSFWIPQLGGQVYAMAGMRSELHLIANEPGSFRGSSANISGTGFAGMHFIAKASSQDEFNQWVQSVKESSNLLNLDTYSQLVQPSSYNPAASYVLQVGDLFHQIIMKYMMPSEMQSTGK